MRFTDVLVLFVLFIILSGLAIGYKLAPDNKKITKEEEIKIDEVIEQGCKRLHQYDTTHTPNPDVIQALIACDIYSREGKKI